MQAQSPRATGHDDRADSLPETFGAVLFDMDGTLVDSDAVVARTWAVWAAKYGLDLADVLRISPGRRDAQAMAELAPQLSAEQIEADSAEALRMEMSDLDGVTAAEGAPQLLRSLQASRVPWAVVTSAPQALAAARLRASELPCPGVLITAEDVECGKPSPEGYLRAARLLGMSPERCVVIEDARAGIQAALSAGMTVIGTGPRADSAPSPHRRVADLTGLAAVPARATDGRPELRLVLRQSHLGPTTGAPTRPGLRSHG